MGALLVSTGSIGQNVKHVVEVLAPKKRTAKINANNNVVRMGTPSLAMAA